VCARAGGSGWWPGGIQLPNVIRHLACLRPEELMRLLLGNLETIAFPFVWDIIQHRWRRRFSRWLRVRWRHHEIRELILAVVKVQLEVLPVVLVLGMVGICCRQAAFVGFLGFLGFF
jgi:hypothetical protein